MVRVLTLFFVVLWSAASLAQTTYPDFASLPGSPSAGERAWILDGNGPTTVGAACAGGGSGNHLCAWNANSAQWVFVQEGAPTPPPGAEPTTWLKAYEVEYDPATSGLAGDTVQKAIDELQSTGLGAAHIIQDEGVALPARANLNLTGPVVSCTDDSGNDSSVCNVDRSNPIRTVVAALPGSPSNTEQTYIVTDGNALDDCATGGGALVVHCAWDGAAFQALGGGGGGGGAPTDALYLVGAANGSLSAEVVVDDLAALNAHLGSSIADGAHTAAGAPSGAQYLVGAADGGLSGEVVVSDLSELNAHLGSSVADGPHTTSAALLISGTIPAARVGAAHVDALSELDAAIRSGLDALLITGTPTTGECAEFDANGDIIGAGAACGSGGATTSSGGFTYPSNIADGLTVGSPQGAGAPFIASPGGAVTANSYTTRRHATDGQSRELRNGLDDGDFGLYESVDNAGLTADQTCVLTDAGWTGATCPYASGGGITDILVLSSVGNLTQSPLAANYRVPLTSVDLEIGTVWDYSAGDGSVDVTSAGTYEIAASMRVDADYDVETDCASFDIRVNGSSTNARTIFGHFDEYIGYASGAAVQPRHTYNSSVSTIVSLSASDTISFDAPGTTTPCGGASTWGNVKFYTGSGLLTIKKLQ